MKKKMHQQQQVMHHNKFSINDHHQNQDLRVTSLQIGLLSFTHQKNAASANPSTTTNLFKAFENPLRWAIKQMAEDVKPIPAKWIARVWISLWHYSWWGLKRKLYTSFSEGSTNHIEISMTSYKSVFKKSQERYHQCAPKSRIWSVSSI